MSIQSMLRRAGQALKAGAEKVGDLAKRAWAGICNGVKLVWGSIRNLFEETDTTPPEVNEVQRREQATEVVRKVLGTNPIQAIQTATPLQRQAMLREVAQQLATALDLKEQTFKVADLGTYTRGLYCYADQCVQINQADLERVPMDSDDAALLLDTVLHEMYHAFQHQAVKSPRHYGISLQQAVEWQENFKFYISPEQNHMLYSKQPVEVTARCFAHAVVRNF